MNQEMSKEKEIKTVETECCVCGSKKHRLLTTGQDYEYGSCCNRFRVVACRRCAHVYLNPKPKLEEFAVIYPDNYYAYDFLNDQKFALARTGKRLIEKGHIKLYRDLIGKTGKILDIGCGDGRLLSLLKGAGSAWELQGLDFNERGNRIAESKGLKVHYGKFEELPFAGGSFDLVIMNEVLEHLYNPCESLAKAKEILKPGGYLVIETPCLGSWDYRLFKNSSWGGYHLPRHLNLFSRKSIRRVLEKAGFEMVKVSSLFSPPFWILSLHHLAYDRGWNKTVVKSLNFYNPLWLAIFTFVDLIQMRFGPTSTMRVIARKK